MNQPSDTKVTRPEAIGSLGDALSGAKAARPANVAADLMQLRNLVGTMNNPEITGASAPPLDQLMREARQEVSAQVAAVPAPPTPPAAAAAAPQSAPAAPTQVISRMFLTGRPGAQPESIAQRAGVKVFSLDEIIQGQLIDFGGLNAGGNAGLITEFKTWGEGTVNLNYPMTLSRIAVCREMHKSGHEAFGTEGYWIASLVDKVVEWEKTHPGSQVLVTGVRFIPDFNSLKKAGFVPFHVMCSNQTASKFSGTQAPGDTLVQILENSVLKEISTVRNGPTLRAIWNDSVPMPAPRFLSPEAFQVRYVRLQLPESAPVELTQEEIDSIQL